MILVYTARILAAVANVQNVLEANGIPCALRNEFLNAGSGEIPVAECWPELWVTNDAHAERARKIIADATGFPASPATPWRCSRCGEEVDADLAQCWSCDAERDD